MTHPGFTSQLDAYLDGELDTVDAEDLVGHLGRCAECAQVRDDRLALRAALMAQVPSFRAPAALRQRVQAAAESAVRATAPRRVVPRGWWRPVAMAASLLLVAVGSWQLALQRSASDALADDVLASHIRSLMPGHLIDVRSSDQHTVKPWFNGRLDFSPPVYDFVGRGYPLIGGRLDYVDDHAAAALVYGRRQHVINAFLWPATGGVVPLRSGGTRQGYHILHWAAAGYTYWVVSDLALPELQEFARLLQQADAAMGPPK